MSRKRARDIILGILDEKKQQLKDQDYIDAVNFLTLDCNSNVKWYSIQYLYTSIVRNNTIFIHQARCHVRIPLFIFNTIEHDIQHNKVHCPHSMVLCNQIPHYNKSQAVHLNHITEDVIFTQTVKIIAIQEGDGNPHDSNYNPNDEDDEDEEEEEEEEDS